MKFLFLNCYDPYNPLSGGAEKFTVNIAKRLVQEGHEVDWLSSDFSGCKDVESKINFIRYGNRITVVFHALQFLFKNRRRYDYVIDQFHAYPFFTPFLVPKRKSITIIHEVAGEIWDYMTFRPINIFGKNFERFLLRTLYKNRVFVTVSKSTKEELKKNGVKDSKMFILRQGIDEDYKKIKKSSPAINNLIYTGGLRKMKRVEDQILALKLLVKDFPQIRLSITGEKTGDYYERLKQIIKREHLEDNVNFVGFLPKTQLIELLSRSYLSLGTSVKEGWGLAISEAAGVGVPSVAYNIAGYRDSIKHLQTGVLTFENNPETLAKMIKKIILDKELYMKLQKECIEESSNMSWQNTYVDFKKVLESLSIIFKDNPKQTNLRHHYAI